MPPSDAKDICELLTALIPRTKKGSVRFWGQWFGRPMDNYHSIVRCHADSDTLRIWFDNGETLTVQSPVGFEVTTDAFWIADADRVRWEWYSYGLPQTPQSLCYREYLREKEHISVTTNHARSAEQLHPSLVEKAVELL